MGLTAEIGAALRVAFPAPGHQVFYEVSDTTGHARSRYADAIAVGIWPSTGHVIHGFEIKISRGDFLREMANPEKSLAIMKHCHRWSFVAPTGLIAPKEIPPGLGLYTFSEGKLRVSVKPDTNNRPAPLTPGFVAALVRRAGEVDASVIGAAVSKAERELRAKHEKIIEDRVATELARRSRRHEDLAAQIEKIEKLSGLKLEEWCDSEAIARAVRMVHDSGIASTYGNVTGLLLQLQTASDRIKKALDACAMPKESP